MAIKRKGKLFICCVHCGTKISKSWLLLGLPWSKYTCPKCNSVYAGTIWRTILIWVASTIVCYLIISVIKHSMNPLFLIPAVILLLISLLINLPKQIKIIDKTEQNKEKISTKQNSK